jgi:hypothetical protein
VSAYGKQGAWSLKLSNSFAFALAGLLDLRKLGFQPERLIFHVASTRAWILFFARWRVPPMLAAAPQVPFSAQCGLPCDSKSKTQQAAAAGKLL